MPNYRRLYNPGGTYFFTLTLADRKSGLLTTHIEKLRQSWKQVETRYPFETIAAVILPDHLHTLWALPPGDHDYVRRISMLKAGFTRALPNALKSTGRKGERGIWQSRYWEHLIRDETDFDNHVGYIHGNPVKHGNVAHPDDWPYSTWHRHKAEYHPDWTLDTLLNAGE